MFNESHISYQGDAEQQYSHRLAAATGGPNAAGAGATFVMSQLENEDIAREEYERVLDDLRHQEGITNRDIRDFERSAIIKKSLDVVK